MVLEPPRTPSLNTPLKLSTLVLSIKNLLDLCCPKKGPVVPQASTILYTLFFYSQFQMMTTTPLNQYHMITSVYWGGMSAIDLKSTNTVVYIYVGQHLSSIRRRMLHYRIQTQRLKVWTLLSFDHRDHVWSITWSMLPWKTNAKNNNYDFCLCLVTITVFP